MPKLLALPLVMFPVITLLPLFTPVRVRVVVPVVPAEMPPPNTRMLEAVVLLFMKE